MKCQKAIKVGPQNLLKDKRKKLTQILEKHKEKIFAYHFDSYIYHFSFEVSKIISKLTAQ